MPLKTPKIALKIISLLNQIHLPWLGISVWGLIKLYVSGIFEDEVMKQAASISWSFFLSLFPFLLFILAIFPYVPNYVELQNHLFNDIIPSVFPSHMEADVKKYITQVVLPKLKSVSPFTIVFSLIFGTNGVHSIINGLNLNTSLKRPFVREYLVSLSMTITFIALVILALWGIYQAEVVYKLLGSEEESWWLAHLTPIISYVSLPLIYSLLLSVLYWVGSLKIKKYKHSLPGALFTTILFVMTTYGFAIYAGHFANYNVLYGSIGSIILIMVWINLNMFLILLGNQLNLAVINLREKQKHRLENDEFHPIL
jgi:membrane protein